MFKNHFFILLILILFVGCNSSNVTIKKQSSKTDKKDYFKLVENEFSGDLAYQTTAFVEKYWRVVGNKGFDASIYEIEKELIRAGFINEDKATSETILTYRIEKRPLKNPTWEPVSATVMINGEDKPLL